MSDPTQPPVASAKPVPAILNSLSTFAANRNWLSSLGGALAMFMALGVLDADQVNTMVSGAQDVMNGLGTMVGGFKKIWLALPVGAVAMLATWAGKAQIINSSVWGSLFNLGKEENKQKGIVVVAPAPIANAVPGANIIPENIATVVVPQAMAQAQAPAAPVVARADAIAQPGLLQK